VRRREEGVVRTSQAMGLCAPTSSKRSMRSLSSEKSCDAVCSKVMASMVCEGV